MGDEHSAGFYQPEASPPVPLMGAHRLRRPDAEPAPRPPASKRAKVKAGPRWPWFKMFAADFLTDVADFNQAETSGFIRLKTYYWHNGGLPDDDDKVRRVARMTKAQWENSRDRLAEMFTSGWRDEYLDSERDKAEDTSAMKAEAGRKGGLSKTRTICTNT